MFGTKAIVIPFALTAVLDEDDERVLPYIYKFKIVKYSSR